ncbi:hypothetical protein GCM10022403_040980 [Streptomyces coacervatus]|uniref:Secreted protein n=1 Tax=Streptomyces coacervatus TaxID=647381 RepID=A0ABP7HUK8_9ACTN
MPITTVLRFTVLCFTVGSLGFSAGVCEGSENADEIANNLPLFMGSPQLHRGRTGGFQDPFI